MHSHALYLTKTMGVHSLQFLLVWRAIECFVIFEIYAFKVKCYYVFLWYVSIICAKKEITRSSDSEFKSEPSLETRFC